jgi:uncharacterized Tic20 family protein
MIRKYFEQQHSVVEADMKEVVVVVIIVVVVVVVVIIIVAVVVVVVIAATVITFVDEVSKVYTCHRHWILRHVYAR